MHNLTAFIRFHATEQPNDLAVVYGHARITYADLLDRALSAGAWLRGEGIGSDVVALVMKNSAGFLDLVLERAISARYSCRSTTGSRRRSPISTTMPASNCCWSTRNSRTSRPACPAYSYRSGRAGRYPRHGTDRRAAQRRSAKRQRSLSIDVHVRDDGSSERCDPPVR